MAIRRRGITPKRTSSPKLRTSFKPKGRRVTGRTVRPLSTPRGVGVGSGGLRTRRSVGTSRRRRFR